MTFQIKTRPQRRARKMKVEVSSAEVVLSFVFWVGTVILLIASIFVALTNLTFYV